MSQKYTGTTAPAAEANSNVFQRIATGSRYRSCAAGSSQSFNDSASVVEIEESEGHLIRETVEFVAERVDRQSGEILGAKLVGLRSTNGRRYTESALRDAVGLYEGATVYLNHPKDGPNSPRDYQDRIAGISGVKFRAGQGLFGNVTVNPKHPMAESVLWDAEHNTKGVGLSHNVLAESRRDNSGETVIESIAKVKSVDLVAGPATTRSMFERDEIAEDDLNVPFPDSALAMSPPQIVAAAKEILSGQLNDMEKVAKLRGLLLDPESFRASSQSTEQSDGRFVSGDARWSPTSASKFRQLCRR